MMQLSSALGATEIRVTFGCETAVCTPDTVDATCEALIAKHGPGIPTFTYWGPAREQFQPEEEKTAEQEQPFPLVTETALVLPSEPTYSDWDTQVVDESAKTRIEAIHEALTANGVQVNASEQLYATGTRMAREGYSTQESRKVKHDRSMPLRDAGEALCQAVRDEQREDIFLSAREAADSIETNGQITLAGKALTETAIRGLLTKIDSPAMTYVIGVGRRILDEAGNEAPDYAAMLQDRAKIAEVLQYELRRRGDVELKLRTRANPGDIYAVVTPSYVDADAPKLVPSIVEAFSSDAKGTWRYDPATTSWELQASVWTPTTVQEQAVGEPFRGYGSFQSRDNGTGRFRGGGGVEMLRCLNASVYLAKSAKVSRVHRGTILEDISLVVDAAAKSIETLIKIWADSRLQVVALPAPEDRPTPIEVAIPGFWRALLTDRRSELQGVLTGKVETHVSNLSAAYFDERRDKSQIVRSDFGQGWTRYIQDLSAPTQRDGEIAISQWLANRRPMRYEAANS
jgi:hypothetical protein